MKKIFKILLFLFFTSSISSFASSQDSKDFILVCNGTIKEKAYSHTGRELAPRNEKLTDEFKITAYKKNKNLYSINLINSDNFFNRLPTTGGFGLKNTNEKNKGFYKNRNFKSFQQSFNNNIYLTSSKNTFTDVDGNFIEVDYVQTISLNSGVYSVKGSSKASRSGSSVELIYDIKAQCSGYKQLARYLNTNTKPFSVNSSSKNEKYQGKKYLNGKEYKFYKDTDFATDDGSERNCNQFVSSNDQFYHCVSSNGKMISYTKDFFKDKGFFKKNDVLRYRITSDGWSVSGGYLLLKEDKLKIGGWVRRNSGVTIYGIFDYGNNKWQAYQDSKGQIQNFSGVSSNKLQDIIKSAKTVYKQAKAVREDLDILLDVNNNKDRYQVTKKTNTKNKKQKNTNIKSYWWVGVLLAVGAFFVYMITTKDLPKTKRKKANSKSNNILASFYRGEQSLVISYWGFYFSGGVIGALLIGFAESSKAGDASIILISLAVLIYTGYAMIGTWRSAENYKIEKKKKKEGAGWAITAQVLIVLAVIRVIVEFFKAFSA